MDIRSRPTGLRNSARDDSEVAFEFAAENIVDAEGAQPVAVQRRVETVRAQARRGIEGARLADHRRGQPRRGVHRQMKRDQIGIGQRGIGEALLGQVRAHDVESFAAQPCRG